MPIPISPITIKDIARQAGVSYATVSRVINETDYPIREETRTKVLEAARELGYTPNLLGRYLKNQHSDTVGILLPNLEEPLFTRSLALTEKKVSERGCMLLLGAGEHNAVREETILKNFVARHVCAAVLMDMTGHEELIRKMEERGIALLRTGPGGAVDLRRLKELFLNLEQRSEAESLPAVPSSDIA